MHKPQQKKCFVIIVNFSVHISVRHFDSVTDANFVCFTNLLLVACYGLAIRATCYLIVLVLSVFCSHSV